MNARRVRLVINPTSGHRRRPRRLDEALAWLAGKGWHVERRQTSRAYDARELAAEAAAAGYDAVLACGGDGTINEVVNGLAGSTTALAVLSAGTVNIWAREAGISRDPWSAADALEYGNRRRVDLGRANGRYFLMLASVGTDSYAVNAVDAASKRRWGRYAYLAPALRDLFAHGGREMTIAVDGQPVTTRTLVVVIGNTRLYGGVLRATRHARLDDGLLDVCVFHGGGPQQFAAHVARTLLRRSDHGGAALYRRGKHIQIDGPAAMPVQADGEPIGYTPMTFESVPAALTVVLPRGWQTPLFAPRQHDETAG